MLEKAKNLRFLYLLLIETSAVFLSLCAYSFSFCLWLSWCYSHNFWLLPGFPFTRILFFSLVSLFLPSCICHTMLFLLQWLPLDFSCKEEKKKKYNERQRIKEALKEFTSFLLFSYGKTTESYWNRSSRLVLSTYSMYSSSWSCTGHNKQRDKDVRDCTSWSLLEVEKDFNLLFVSLLYCSLQESLCRK